MAILARHPAFLLALAPRRLAPIAGRRQSTLNLSLRVEQHLARMRDARRRSLLIVDLGCGDGRLLIDAAAAARELGFVAIEAFGFDRSPWHRLRAASAARLRRDPAIGFVFAPLDPAAIGAIEPGQADIVIAARQAGWASAAECLAGGEGLVLARR